MPERDLCIEGFVPVWEARFLVLLGCISDLFHEKVVIA